jgi:hypothetical protein
MLHLWYDHDAVKQLTHLPDSWYERQAIVDHTVNNKEPQKGPSPPSDRLNLKTEVLWNCETSVTTRPTTQRHVPEGWKLKQHRCENLQISHYKSSSKSFFCD